MLTADVPADDSVVGLHTQREAILTRLLEAARGLPCHQAHPDQADSDDIPRILDALLRSLDSGIVVDDVGHLAALAHAATRAAQGLDSADVVTEFRLLRSELNRALTTGHSGVPARLPEIEMRLHDGLDALIPTTLRAFDALSRSRAVSLDAMERVAHEISALRPLEESLRVVCDRVRELLSADCALLALPEQAGILRFQAVSGASVQDLRGASVAHGQGATWRAYSTGEAVLIFPQGR